MKNFILPALILSLLLALTACGSPNGEGTSDNPSFGSGTGGSSTDTGISSEEISQPPEAADPPASEKPATDATPQNTPKPKAGQVEIKGHIFEIGMKITDDILSPLGSPEDIQEGNNCLYGDGKDTIYVYGGYTLYTYIEGKNSILYVIEITDPEVELSSGARVGMTFDETGSLYDTDPFETGTGIKYDIGENLYHAFYHDGTDGDTVSLMEIGKQ